MKWTGLGWGGIGRKGTAAAIGGLALVAIAAVQSCKGSVSTNNGIDIEISPDMTIHAFGLEDALHQLTGIYRACLQGQFHRPCTQEEEAALERLIEKVMDRKGHA